MVAQRHVLGQLAVDVDAGAVLADDQREVDLQDVTGDGDDRGGVLQVGGGLADHLAQPVDRGLVDGVLGVQGVEPGGVDAPAVGHGWGGFRRHPSILRAAGPGRRAAPACPGWDGRHDALAALPPAAARSGHAAAAGRRAARVGGRPRPCRTCGLRCETAEGWWDRWARTAAEAVPEGADVVLGWSGAGVVLPQVAVAVGAVRVVWVDAVLPAVSGATYPARELRSRVAALSREGRIAPWPTWWGPDAMAELVPDDALRAEITARGAVPAAGPLRRGRARAGAVARRRGHLRAPVPGLRHRRRGGPPAGVAGGGRRRRCAHRRRHRPRRVLRLLGELRRAGRRTPSPGS